MVSHPATQELRELLDAVRDHLAKAQALMDSINPDSVFGARVQQLLDELDEQTLRDLARDRRSDVLD